jgi:predicted PurR-regulated permease PerM
LLVITPIVSFFLLRDWDRITAKIDGYLPKRYAPTIREQLKRIDQTLAGYIRGQVHVMLVLGVFYAVGLSIIGLDFAILVGMAGGILVILPYLGVVIAGALSVGIAYVQFHDWQPVAMVAGFFVIGQMIEGYVLTPKLVGDRVGLHPLWLIFGMLAGAALFGFVGVLLAIPVSAVLGVLVRFALQQYLESDYYNG